MPKEELIKQLKETVIRASKSKDFIHHKWFVKWHLEIVEKISLELCDVYSDANSELVLAMVWMHDYGKILDFDNQYETTQVKGKDLLVSVGFNNAFSQKVIDYIKILDNKMIEELSKAPIEVQIVSSADAASHFVGPFFSLWWHENAQKPFEELMEDNLKKAKKDWERKMVLPEVRKSFEKRHRHLLEMNGILPKRFIKR